MADSKPTGIQGGMEFALAAGDSAVGYLRVSPQPSRPGMVKRTIELGDLIEYRGPAVYLDFDQDGELLGIEIIGDAPKRKP